MSELAGELLAKDVGILAELLGPSRPPLIDAADAAVAKMSLNPPEGADR